MTTPERIDLPAIEARCRTATEGPWSYDHLREDIRARDDHHITDFGLWSDKDADGEFCAQARADLPALCAFVRELAAHLEGFLPTEPSAGGTQCAAARAALTRVTR